MSELNYTTETIDGDKYYTTVSDRGNQTMIFSMLGNTFVQTNNSAPKAIQDVKKLSKDAEALLAIIEAGKEEQKALPPKSKKQSLRLRLAESHTSEEIHQMIQDVLNDPESKEGATGIHIFNKKAIKKMDEMSWAIYYRSRHAQKQTPHAYSCNSMRLH